ncbi:MAG: YlxR family protein [Deltaproteobacteria bacterium]|nr:YlxR family protein [Deltaproteobacteria bacterium]
MLPQHELVRVVFEGSRLRIDRQRRLPGRGAYVHAAAKCVTIPGLARSLRRTVTTGDVQRIVSELSPVEDNSPEIVQSHLGDGDPGEKPLSFNPGLASAKPVETTSSDHC